MLLNDYLFVGLLMMILITVHGAVIFIRFLLCSSLKVFLCRFKLAIVMIFVGIVGIVVACWGVMDRNWDLIYIYMMQYNLYHRIKMV